MTVEVEVNGKKEKRGFCISNAGWLRKDNRGYTEGFPCYVTVAVLKRLNEYLNQDQLEPHHINHFTNRCVKIEADNPKFDAGDLSRLIKHQHILWGKK